MIVKCLECNKDMMLAAVSTKKIGTGAISNDYKFYIATCLKCGKQLR